MQAEPDEEAAGGAGRRPGGAEVQRDAQRVRAAARPRLDGRHQRLRALRGAGGVVQGSAKSWAPGCVNAAGRPGRSDKQQQE